MRAGYVEWQQNDPWVARDVSAQPLTVDELAMLPVGSVLQVDVELNPQPEAGEGSEDFTIRVTKRPDGNWRLHRWSVPSRALAGRPVRECVRAYGQEPLA